MQSARQLYDGIYFDEPAMFIPWSLEEKDLLSSNFLWEVVNEKNHNYKLSGKINNEAIICNCYLYFLDGRLRSIRIHRNSGYFEGKEYISAKRQSFREIDQFLVKNLGKPHLLGRLYSKLTEPSYTWETQAITVKHSLYEHFGLDEELVIKIKR